MKRVMSHFFLAILFVGEASGGFTAPKQMPEGETYYCPHPSPGYTRTEDMKWIDLSSLAPFIDILNFSAKTQGFIGDWKFESGPDTVSGILEVDSYFAFDGPVACQHGADLELRVHGLNGLAKDERFSWVQYFNESDDSVGHGPNTIDPPISDNNADRYPFYYDRRSGDLFSKEFHDHPSDEIPDEIRHEGGVSFVTFLTSWDDNRNEDGSPKPIKVYGAVTWGYTYACAPVPEPSSTVLVLMGIITLSGRWQISRCRRK